MKINRWSNWCDHCMAPGRLTEDSGAWGQIYVLIVCHNFSKPVKIVIHMYKFVLFTNLYIIYYFFENGWLNFPLIPKTYCTITFSRVVPRINQQTVNCSRHLVQSHLQQLRSYLLRRSSPQKLLQLLKNPIYFITLAIYHV